MNNFHPRLWMGLLGVFLLNTLAAQDFKADYYQSVCACMEALPDSSGEAAFKNCFLENLLNHKEELELLVDPDSDKPAYEQGQEIGRKLVLEGQAELIQNCDAYYQWMHALREQSFVNMRQRYPSQALDSLNQLLQKEIDLETLWEKGNAYFAFEDWEEAEKCYQECLKINSRFFPAILFLAWLRERQGNYEEAVQLYQRLIRTSQNEQFQIFLEMAKRKAQE